MSESRLRGPKQFGQRNEQQTITISSNGRTRQYNVNPAVLIVSACVFCMLMVGYLISTAYLVFRDDLIASSIVHQARIKHEYEDRIAALRSKVDKITSRQLLDQQAVEAQVADLVKQQEMLSGRSGELNGLFERAKKSGLGSATIAVPELNPTKHSSLETDAITTGSVFRGSAIAMADTGILRGSVGEDSEGNPSSQFAGLDVEPPSKKLFGAVVDQIKQVKNAQYSNLLRLTHEARHKGKGIASVLTGLGVPLSQDMIANIGGPYEPARNTADFDELASDLLTTLDTIDSLKAKTHSLPLKRPVADAVVSSRFGNRVDPFHKKSAFHAGLDFKASTGTGIIATGNGVVKKARRNGGYGLMVIIDHGNGITTRYAHMSKILVSEGDKVRRGTLIGKVGSTGRSTGPHLHYEVRQDDEATNPVNFLKAGARLSSLL